MHLISLKRTFIGCRPDKVPPTHPNIHTHSVGDTPTHPHIHTHSVGDRVYVPSLLLLIPPCLLTSKHRHKNHTYLILTYQQLGKGHNFLYITFWVHMLCVSKTNSPPRSVCNLSMPCKVPPQHNQIKKKILDHTLNAIKTRSVCRRIYCFLSHTNNAQKNVVWDICWPYFFTWCAILCAPSFWLIATQRMRVYWHETILLCQSGRIRLSATTKESKQ